MKRVRLNHVDDPRRFGQRLREARDRAGLSQHALSFPGCTNAYLSRIEAGERTPSLQLIHELARRLDVSPEWLATGVEGAAAVDRELVDAEVALRLGEGAAAGEVYDRRLQHNPRDAAALAGLGELALLDGHAAQAVTLLEQALERGRTVDRPSAVEALARAYVAAGRTESATSLLEHATSEADEAEATVEAFRFRVLLADVAVDAGEPKLAERHLVAAMQHAEDLRNPIATARALWTQSRLHARRESPRLAARYAQRASAILERAEAHAYLAKAHRLLAHTQIETGDPDAALEQLRRGREALGSALSREDDARLALEDARALALKGKGKAAAARAADVLELLDSLDPPEQGRALTAIAHVFRSSGDTARAVELYEQALDRLERDAVQDVGEAGSSLAELLEELGRDAEALAAYKRVVAAQRAARPAPTTEPQLRS